MCAKLFAKLITSVIVADMVNSRSKTGRPMTVYKTSWGEQVPGLRRIDGRGTTRWSTSWPNRIFFTEADERLAVARFKAMQVKESPLGTITAHATAESAIRNVAKRAEAGQKQVNSHKAADGQGYAVSDNTLTDAQWAWLRQQVMDRPQWVAEQIQIEQIGYLSDLKKPSDSPTLESIGEIYFAKPGLSENEVSHSKLFWKEFTKRVGVETIRQITHEVVVQYERKILAAGLAPKSISHRFSKVKTIIAYALKRGQCPSECRQALDCLAMLEVENHNPLDPQPISPADFWKVHGKAVEAEDQTFAALMLAALNSAMYGGEVAALKWEEIDLSTRELVTRRPKTGVSRVAILWPETIKALKALPRQGEFCFYTRIRSFTTFSVLDCWRQYREAAKLGDELKFSQIRDAAYSVACKTTNLDQARVLAGHRLPGSVDHYVRRRPDFVKDACEAIRKAFCAR